MTREVRSADHHINGHCNGNHRYPQIEHEQDPFTLDFDDDSTSEETSLFSKISNIG